MAQENPNDPDLTAARDELGLVRLHLTLAAVAAESAEALLLRTIRESPEAEETVEVRS